LEFESAAPGVVESNDVAQGGRRRSKMMTAGKTCRDSSEDVCMTIILKPDQ
jgi:hypothetical protein